MKPITKAKGDLALSGCKPWDIKENKVLITFINLGAQSLALPTGCEVSSLGNTGHKEWNRVAGKPHTFDITFSPQCQTLPEKGRHQREWD